MLGDYQDKIRLFSGLREPLCQVVIIEMFKKVTVMPKGQFPQMKGSIGNILIS